MQRLHAHLFPPQYTVFYSNFNELDRISNIQDQTKLRDLHNRVTSLTESTIKYLCGQQSQRESYTYGPTNAIQSEHELTPLSAQHSSLCVDISYLMQITLLLQMAMKRQLHLSKQGCFYYKS
jgi:hypothetical protein